MVAQEMSEGLDAMTGVLGGSFDRDILDQQDFRRNQSAGETKYPDRSVTGLADNA